MALVSPRVLYVSLYQLTSLCRKKPPEHHQKFFGVFLEPQQMELTCEANQYMPAINRMLHYLTFRVLALAEHPLPCVHFSKNVPSRACFGKTRSDTADFPKDP